MPRDVRSASSWFSQCASRSARQEGRDLSVRPRAGQHEGVLDAEAAGQLGRPGRRDGANDHESGLRDRAEHLRERGHEVHAVANLVHVAEGEDDAATREPELLPECLDLGGRRACRQVDAVGDEVPRPRRTPRARSAGR